MDSDNEKFVVCTVVDYEDMKDFMRLTSAHQDRVIMTQTEFDRLQRIASKEMAN